MKQQINDFYVNIKKDLRRSFLWAVIAVVFIYVLLFQVLGPLLDHALKGFK